MAHLGARASDWHTDNPRLRPGLWIASLIGAAIVVFAVIATVGSLVNGNGHPMLDHQQQSYRFPVERWPA